MSDQSSKPTKDIPLYTPDEDTVIVTAHSRPVDVATYIHGRSAQGKLFTLVFSAAAAIKAIRTICILTHSTLHRNGIILTFHFAYCKLKVSGGIFDVTVASPIFNDLPTKEEVSS